MPNRLAQSSSLYLRQHADNPVDWQPWDEPALAQARQRDIPILLSIGYAACHWCHVMAHEAFADATTAARMNALFVNIKLDREEHPALDRLYQLSHQLLTGRGGGWPLTVFLDPHTLRPFFTGTYFPLRPRHGLPAFGDVLQRAREWYDGNRAEVRELGQRIDDAILAIQSPKATSPDLPGPELLTEAARRIQAAADPVQGGFGGAPKFPQAPLLALLPVLAHSLAHEPESRGSLDGILHTALRAMSTGGMRDPLDGGFYRYCVDADWTIPHFEKMLYDNALLLPLYAEAARTTGDAWFKEVAEGIAGWLLHDMRQPHGGFAASVDADAGGVEGGFHVWQRGEAEALLNPAEFAEAGRVLGLDSPPNFAAQELQVRAWHLTRRVEPRDPELLRSALAKLGAARARRVAPATDPRVLSGWNALCVEGLARAGQALQREDWLDAAASCHDLLRLTLFKDGELAGVHAEGRNQFSAGLDDYAWLLQATLTLAESRATAERLGFAIELAGILKSRFHDPGPGAFFLTPSGSDVPMQRLKPLQDDATPSGNGVAARALLRLAHLSGCPGWLQLAESALEFAAADLGKYPLGHASLLAALADWLNPPAQVFICAADAISLAEWRAVLAGRPGISCYAVVQGLAQAGNSAAIWPADWPAAAFPEVKAGQTLAMVCLQDRCLPPVETPAELLAQLAQPGFQREPD